MVRAVPGRPSIAVNTRVLLNPTTGVQRYATAILPRLEGLVRTVQPRVRMTSVLNQGWEQFVLPLRLRGDLLWSPANTGPLSVHNQVVTVHDAAPLDHPEWYRGSFIRYFNWLLPRLVRGVRHVITDSQYSRDRLVALTGVLPEKITVIPLGVGDGFFPRSEEEILGACARFGLVRDAYILYLGSIEPRKNLPRLLEAWRATRHRLPSGMVLALAGGYANLRAFRKVKFDPKREGVRFLGHVEGDVTPALLGGARAFVYVSLYEGFGLPPLEAMSVGTPVLTSAATSVPEVVADAALAVDPEDTGAIAKGIEQLVQDDDLRDRLRRAGMERARGFTWEESARQTRELLLRFA